MHRYLKNITLLKDFMSLARLLFKCWYAQTSKLFYIVISEIQSSRRRRRRRQKILQSSHKINQKSRFSIVHRTFIIKTYARVKGLGIWCLLDRASLWKLKNKKPTWCPLLFYCASYRLNIFRALLCPSSGARSYNVDYHVGGFILGLL